MKFDFATMTSTTPQKRIHLRLFEWTQYKQPVQDFQDRSVVGGNVRTTSCELIYRGRAYAAMCRLSRINTDVFIFSIIYKRAHYVTSVYSFAVLPFCFGLCVEIRAGVAESRIWSVRGCSFWLFYFFNWKFIDYFLFIILKID